MMIISFSQFSANNSGRTGIKFCSLCNIIMASFSVFSFLTGPLSLPPRLASRVLGLLCASLIDFCFSLFPHCGAWSQARWEAAWPSGQRFGLAISRCRVRVPLWPLAGFVLSRPKFRFSATLVNSQLVAASCRLGFLLLLCSVWIRIICF